MSFSKEKHIRYWRMCAKILPDHYISNDGSRMSLGFFIVSALDLLDALDNINPAERQSWTSWIYTCQLSEGGFRGFTGTHLGQARSTSNSHWDPATIPATFFALATLLVLGDDLSRVKRQECLSWLPRLQRQDGSFGEVLSQNGRIEGDRDLRQCCCAAGIAYILRERYGSPRPVFNESKLVDYIQSCQSQAGGFGVSPMRESHSGLSYCAVAALSFIQRLQGRSFNEMMNWIPARDECLRWFVERQTTLIDEDEDADHSEEESTSTVDQMSGHNDPNNQSSPNQDIRIAGFNGREVKMADTCYCFWNTGALAILQKHDLVNGDAMRNFLLNVTQHLIGGFGKGRGDPPDILHSYLGLAALALQGHSEIKALDPTMCISVDAAARLDRVR